MIFKTERHAARIKTAGEHVPPHRGGYGDVYRIYLERPMRYFALSTGSGGGGGGGGDSYLSVAKRDRDMHCDVTGRILSPEGSPIRSKKPQGGHTPSNGGIGRGNSYISRVCPDTILARMYAPYNSALPA